MCFGIFALSHMPKMSHGPGLKHLFDGFTTLGHTVSDQTGKMFRNNYGGTRADSARRQSVAPMSAMHVRSANRQPVQR